jgi:3-polyprenyl-4-hydroxybenzoate decarboxylase
VLAVAQRETPLHMVQLAVVVELGGLQVVVVALVFKATPAVAVEQVVQQLLATPTLLGKALVLDLEQYHDYL